jgi:hypothetical protein
MDTSKKKKPKVVSYSPHHSFKIGDKKHDMMSQVYRVGIYVIYDSRPDSQGSTTPEGIRAIQNKLKKAETAKEITDLYLSPAIRVTMDTDGFYIQLPDEKLKEKVD